MQVQQPTKPPDDYFTDEHWCEREGHASLVKDTFASAAARLDNANTVEARIAHVLGMS